MQNDREVLDHVRLTLDKMALGGIYDQVGGGFARYSTDALWKVPHFEKMLYDNAQLISLYSKAYSYFGSVLYRRVVEESCAFIEREMTGPDGEFYSALDADSEGEEGKFYVWSESELKAIKGLDLDFLRQVYRLEDKYQWEGAYILHRNADESGIRASFGLDEEAFYRKLDVENSILLKNREGRVRPGLDDKSLTSWNALMITAYCEAFKALGKREYLTNAQRNAEHLFNDVWDEKPAILYHSFKAGNKSIPGFLEDYASLISACLDLYEVSFDEKWLKRASALSDKCSASFWSEKEGLYYFTSSEEKDLVVRKMDVQDNVIPSANSIMAMNLFKLGSLYDREAEIQRSEKMMDRVKASMSSYGSAFSNWAILLNALSQDYYEVAVVGSDYAKMRSDLQKEYKPNTLYLGSEGESQIPLLQNKYTKGKTIIYVCVDKSCKLPVESASEALNQISFDQ